MSTPLPVATFPEAEEAAFLAAVAAAMPDTFARTYSFEPKGFDGGKELPALTLYWSTVQIDDNQTGPLVKEIWGWRVNVYCDLGRGYEPAQKQLKTIVPALIKAVTVNPSLGIDQRWFRLSDPGTEPTVDNEERLIWKTLRLECELEALAVA